MKLKDYQKKRDASLTNEPFGDDPEERGPTYRGAFVVHQHDATRMHHDLRLEVGGVLTSFAIPKGPTLDPSQKHLAVHTEDHPIEYLDFEAVIPEGTYGAGPMIVWDFGTVSYLDDSAEASLKSGKLHFALEGHKLKGRFALVRVKSREKGTRGEASREWLFFKKTDGFASERDIVSELPRSVLSGLTVDELRSLPERGAQVLEQARKLGATPTPSASDFLHPMLAELGDLPASADYLYELKLDGVRILAQKRSGRVELRYRSGRDCTSAYPEVVRAVSALAGDDLLLDGEIVAFDEGGKPNFARLARRIHRGGSDLRGALLDVPVVYMVFDLLAIGGHSLLELALRDRKRLLARLICGRGVVRVLDHLEGAGEALFEFCRDNDLEGVVSKRLDAPYRPGPKRGGDWIKTKCEKQALFVVVGHSVGDSGRKIGSLDVASFSGERLTYRGRVGSGLGEREIKQLLERLAPLANPSQTSEGKYEKTAGPRTHVAPKLVVRVRFLEFSEEGRLRHPVYLGIEEGAATGRAIAAPHDEAAQAFPAPAIEQPVEAAPKSNAVRVTNPTKIFFPEEGLTKRDLVDYYLGIAPYLLPFLRDRPVMLVRYPDGIDGKHFYQWNVPHGMPAWVRSVELGKHVSSPDESDHKKHVFLVDRPESLAYLANLACIPIHILASRVQSPDSADFLTIDFDVKHLDLRAAITLALTLKQLTDDLGLSAFPKTSGQTGLHVFIPLGRGVTPSAARQLADLLGRLLVAAHPSIATMERTVSKRGAKVYVDTGQTGPSRTIVAPYSVRATPGARVSTPLEWEEVTPDLDPAVFNLNSVRERVEKLGDPMAALFDFPPDLASVMARLGELLKPA